MIGLDTNVLVRYFIDDPNDHEAQRQKILAGHIIEGDSQLCVAKTVLLEFVWLMSGVYRLSRGEVLSVLEFLSDMERVCIEDERAVNTAIQSYKNGFGFADALHHASYSTCETMATFDDKKFATKVNKLGMLPRVVVPKAR